MPLGMADGQRAPTAASGEGTVSHCPLLRHPLHSKGTRLDRRLGDALQGARCPFPMSLVLSQGTIIITNLSLKPSSPFCPQSHAEQDEWDWGTHAGLRGTGWNKQNCSVQAWL